MAIIPDGGGNLVTGGFVPRHLCQESMAESLAKIRVRLATKIATVVHFTIRKIF